MSRWGKIQGIDGNWYLGYYFLVYERSDLADNESSFKKHLLLEFLGYLGVLQYVKDHDQTYEIILKVKDG